MAHQRVDLEAVEAADLVKPQPQPVHPGVDHHVARPPGRDVLPASDLLDAVEYRPRPGGERDLDVARTRSVEHGEVHAVWERAQLLGFRPARHIEGPAAGLEQRPHRPARANSVTVGLDRRSALAARGFGEPAPIVLERGAVERQSKRAVHLRALAALLLCVELRGCRADHEPSPGRSLIASSQFSPSNQSTISSGCSSRQCALTLHESGCERGW